MASQVQDGKIVCMHDCDVMYMQSFDSQTTDGRPL